MVVFFELQSFFQGCTSRFLQSTNVKVFAPLDWVLGYMFAALALQPQHNLFCSFSLLVENRLSLPTIP